MKQPVKIVIGGSGAVGKTTLCKRLNASLEEEIPDTKMTLGVEIHALDLSEEELACLWDLGGQDRFRFCQDAYVYGVKILVLMFSVDMVNSIRDLDNWLKLFPEDKAPKKVFLIANKIDSSSQLLLKEDLQDLIDEYEMEYFELSAKTGLGVLEFKTRLQEVSRDLIEDFSFKKKK